MKSTKAIVASNFEGGSQFANVINTVKTAQDLAAIGLNVILICKKPSSGTIISEQELALLYSVNKIIKWIQLCGDYSSSESSREKFAQKVVKVAMDEKVWFMYTRVFHTQILAAQLCSKRKAARGKLKSLG